MSPYARLQKENRAAGRDPNCQPDDKKDRQQEGHRKENTTHVKKPLQSGLRPRTRPLIFQVEIEPSCQSGSRSGNMLLKWIRVRRCNVSRMFIQGRVFGTRLNKQIGAQLILRTCQRLILEKVTSFNGLSRVQNGRPPSVHGPPRNHFEKVLALDTHLQLSNLPAERLPINNHERVSRNSNHSCHTRSCPFVSSSESVIGLDGSHRSDTMSIHHNSFTYKGITNR